MAAQTSNEQFLDALIRHQIYLIRVAGSLRNKINGILAATEDDLRDAIERRLQNNKGFDTYSGQRLKVLERLIHNIRQPAWDKVDEAFFAEVDELARYEPEFTSAAVKAVAPVVLDTIMPSVPRLKAIARATPMEGRVLKEWASRQRATDLSRIMSAVQVGMVQGEDSRAIANRVVGTRQMHKIDGVTEITRRDADSLTRTMTNHVSNVSRQEFLRLNDDLFEWEVLHATLDSRTTPQCRALDGKRFRVGKGPMPPLHFRCRDVRVAALDGEVLGDRPMKPVTEQMLVREYARSNGLEGIEWRKDLPRGSMGRFDQYARGRVRELVGRVPASTTYQQFLERASSEFQDDVLGQTRALLFRKGGVTLDRFVDAQGTQINLGNLARIERGAFIKAGLDPGEFQ